MMTNQDSNAQCFKAIGLMSGTSMDGIDVALVHTDGEDIVSWKEGRTYPYPEILVQALFELLREPERARLEALTAMEEAVTDAHCDAVHMYLDELKIAPHSIDIIGFHGQTVLHRPKVRFTRQLGFGQRMADVLGIEVVDQFRLADVAAGGEGAPFVPVFHQALASMLPKPLAILNLGGVGNVTYLDHDTMIAFDTGPAGALIDDYMRQYFGKSFDEAGQLASKGQASAQHIQAFLDDSFFKEIPPKSLDRNAFHLWMQSIEHLAPHDALATLTQYTIESIVAAKDHMPLSPLQWLVTGGGRKNTYILERLRERLQKPVNAVETVAWDGDFLEAQAFGYLAVRHLKGMPLSFPQTTGVPEPMCGGRLNYPMRVENLKNASL